MNADVTETPIDPVELRVDRRTIEMLHARGLLSAAARDHALDLVDPPRAWGLWTARILTVFGVALILSGLVYFFAFNWDHIPPMAKLGGIAGLLVAAVATATILGLDHWIAGVAVTVATVSVGLFLAVFGQIYQTGADAWGLFFAWALLTLPWALLSASAPTWAVWLVVANLAIRLWWQQNRPADEEFFAGSTLALVLFDGAFLVLREGLAARGLRWPAARWTRFLLIVPVLCAASLSLIGWIVHRHDLGWIDRTSAATSAVAIVGCLVVYRRAVPDVAALALALIAACVVSVMMIFVSLDRAAPGGQFGVLLVTGLFTLAIFAAAVAWLRHVGRVLEARHE
jgi:uncharacterized membrane protein